MHELLISNLSEQAQSKVKELMQYALDYEGYTIEEEIQAIEQTSNMYLYELANVINIDEVMHIEEQSRL